MKNYEIGRLAEGVLRGAKMIIVFERERSVLKTVVVFEREQLYRPSGDLFWPPEKQPRRSKSISFEN